MYEEELERAAGIAKSIAEFITSLERQMAEGSRRDRSDARDEFEIWANGQELVTDVWIQIPRVRRRTFDGIRAVLEMHGGDRGILHAEGQGPATLTVQSGQVGFTVRLDIPHATLVLESIAERNLALPCPPAR